MRGLNFSILIKESEYTMDSKNTVAASNSDDLDFDPAIFDAMKQKLAKKNQDEISEIESSLASIQFSMSRLEAQYTEKKRILENRKAELERISNMTLDQLLANVPVAE